jgi:hypothetical protein
MFKRRVLHAAFFCLALDDFLLRLQSGTHKEQTLQSRRAVFWGGLNQVSVS